MALKLKTKVLVPPKPPDSADNSATSASIGDENSFRKHLYNQTVVSGWYVSTFESEQKYGTAWKLKNFLSLIFYVKSK